MKDENKVKVLKALANTTRLALVRQLNGCDSRQKSCGELSERSMLSQPTLSHHFARLIEAGIITEKKIHTRKIYQLDERLLAGCGIDITKL